MASVTRLDATRLNQLSETLSLPASCRKTGNADLIQFEFQKNAEKPLRYKCMLLYFCCNAMLFMLAGLKK